MTPYSRSINLLELLKEFRETLNIYQFSKECDKGYRWTSNEELQCSKVWLGPKHRSFCPYGVGLCYSPGVDVLTNVKALQFQYLWEFMEASSCRRDCSLTPFSDLPLLKRMGVKTENSKLLIVAWPFQWPTLIPEPFEDPTWGCFINKKSFLSPRKLQGFQETGVRARVKNQILEQKMIILLLPLRQLQRW